MTWVRILCTRVDLVASYVVLRANLCYFTCMRGRRPDVPPPSPVENGLAIIGEIAQTDAGEETLVESLRGTLDGLLPEQRAEVFLRLFGWLDPSTRLAILGGATSLAEMRGYLEAREREPQILRDIIEHGRTAHELNATIVPPGHLLEVLLFNVERGRVVINRDHLVPPTAIFKSKLGLISMGDGAFKPVAQFTFINGEGQRSNVYEDGLVQIAAFGLGGVALQSNIGFGHTLAIKFASGGSAVVAHIDSSERDGSRLVVGKIFLDDESVLHEER